MVVRKHRITIMYYRRRKKWKRWFNDPDPKNVKFILVFHVKLADDKDPITYRIRRPRSYFLDGFELRRR